MIRFALILFAAIVFFLVAVELLTPAHHAVQWEWGAFSAWALSFLVDDGISFVTKRRAAAA
jgi:hypothetical protein